MKILFLDPRREATSVIELLEKSGHAVVHATTPEEAQQLLELQSGMVELVVAHREDAQGNGDPGMTFVKLIKEDPAHSSLPLFITTASWEDDDFAEHQAGPLGAHAYLVVPYFDHDLLGLIGRVFGKKEGTQIDDKVEVAQDGDVTRIVDSGKSEFTGSLPGLTRVMDLSEAKEESEDLPEIQLSGDQQSEDETGTVSPVKGDGPDSPVELTETVLTPPDGVNLPQLEDEHAPTEMGTAVVQPSGDLTGAFQQGEVPEVAGEFQLTPPEFTGVFQVPEPLQVSEPDQAPVLEESAPAVPGLTPASNLEEPHLDAESLEESPEASSLSVPILPESVAPKSTVPDTPPDQEVADSMPYLYEKPMALPKSPPPSLRPPVGDAIIPGGAASAPDMETIKQYLTLREQDVAALSIQLEAAKDQVRNLEKNLRQAQHRANDLEGETSEQKKQIDAFEDEKAGVLEASQKEVTELKFELQTRREKALVLERQVQDSVEQIETFKKRVRHDIIKIRTREKELENQLEILRVDSEALVGLREARIMELKRKLDIAEFNIELLKDQYRQEKEHSRELQKRLDQVAKAMKVAGGLIEEHPIENDEADDERRVS